MPLQSHADASNCLLNALPDRDRRRLFARAEHVDLGFAEVLWVPGGPINHVYFPTNSFVSLVATIDGSSDLEVGLVGNEGMLGIPLMLGVAVSALHGTVQGPGAALRMEAAAFRHALADSTALQRSLNRYLHVTLAQLAQMAACTRFHSLEARVARWMLTTGDRAHADEFRLTHELLAHQLAVRRVGVTMAAGSLLKRRLIRYSRGRITILHRAGLEAVACGCYRASRDLYERVLGDAPRARKRTA